MCAHMNNTFKKIYMYEIGTILRAQSGNVTYAYSCYCTRCTCGHTSYMFVSYVNSCMYVKIYISVDIFVQIAKYSYIHVHMCSTCNLCIRTGFSTVPGVCILAYIYLFII